MHIYLNEKEEYLDYTTTPYMRIRQPVMMEFWLSSSFINFLIISLFKFMC